jgi:hypothetical protein
MDLFDPSRTKRDGTQSFTLRPRDSQGSKIQMVIQLAKNKAVKKIVLKQSHIRTAEASMFHQCDVSTYREEEWVSTVAPSRINVWPARHVTSRSVTSANFTRFISENRLRLQTKFL